MKLAKCPKPGAQTYACPGPASTMNAAIATRQPPLNGSWKESPIGTVWLALNFPSAFTAPQGSKAWVSSGSRIPSTTQRRVHETGCPGGSPRPKNWTVRSLNALSLRVTFPLVESLLWMIDNGPKVTFAHTKSDCMTVPATAHAEDGANATNATSTAIKAVAARVNVMSISLSPASGRPWNGNVRVLSKGSAHGGSPVPNRGAAAKFLKCRIRS